ncbi:unnamed protein product, partial [Didymodactylos carnosus]
NNVSEKSPKQQKSKPTTVTLLSSAHVSVDDVDDNNEQEEHIVYIPDLPDSGSDLELENTIGYRLQTVHGIRLERIQIISDIGVGILYLKTLEDKLKFIQNIEALALSKSTTITFNEDIELVSYMVFDIKHRQEQDQDLPTAEEVRERWSTLLNSKRPPKCKIVSMQFPNIIKVKSYSIDDLLTAARFGGFRINDLY